MEVVLAAFRLAHRTVKAPNLEGALGGLPCIPSEELRHQTGSWDNLLLARVVLILRERGVPEPGAAEKTVFKDMVQALKQYKEEKHDSDSQGGRAAR